MRALMLQGAFAFGVLSIGLLALAAMHRNNDLALMLALSASMSSYVSQFVATITEDEHPSGFILVLNWFFWIVAVSLAVASFWALFTPF